MHKTKVCRSQSFREQKRVFKKFSQIMSLLSFLVLCQGISRNVTYLKICTKETRLLLNRTRKMSYKLLIITNVKNTVKKNQGNVTNSPISPDPKVNYRFLWEVLYKFPSESGRNSSQCLTLHQKWLSQTCTTTSHIRDVRTGCVCIICLNICLYVPRDVVVVENNLICQNRAMTPGFGRHESLWAAPAL